MKKKHKKKKDGVPVTSLKMAEHERRKAEIEKHGKLVSLRPGVSHDSSKKYNRKKLQEIQGDE